MEKMINITEIEATTIYGGRDEMIAKIMYSVAKAVSSFAKLFYVGFREGGTCIGYLGSTGDYTIWK